MRIFTLLLLLPAVAHAQVSVLIAPTNRPIRHDEFAALAPCLEIQWKGIDTTRVYNAKCQWRLNHVDAGEVTKDLSCYATTYSDPTADEYAALETAGRLPFDLDPDKIDMETETVKAVIIRYGPEPQEASLACWSAVALALLERDIKLMKSFRLWYAKGQYWAQTTHLETKTNLEYLECRKAKTCRKIAE